MSHFAKTALMRKRAVEKRSEKHNAKNTENSWEKYSEFGSIHFRFRMPFGLHFDLILAWFFWGFSYKNYEKPLKWRSRALF